jgi:hypothetical protein
MSILITLNTEDECNMCKGAYIIEHETKFECIKYAIVTRLRSFQRGKDARGDQIMDLAMEEARRHGFSADIENAISSAVYVWLDHMEDEFHRGELIEYLTLVESTMHLCSLKTTDICALNRPIPLIQ